MPELRHDELTGRLVLLAPGRAARPYTNPNPDDPPDMSAGGATACPFCAEHEHDTPPEVARTGPGAPDTPGWRVRVVPNLYPIVGGRDAAVGATGVHEVVMLSPDHDRPFARLHDDQAVEALMVMRGRVRAHTAAGRAHVQVLVNHGRAAGASIAHPHGQIVALDFVPPAVSVATERFAAAPRDLVLADRDDAAGDGRVVSDDGEVGAWCPHASCAPFEVRLSPIGAGPRFADSSDTELAATAIGLRDLLARVAAVLGDVPYNVVVHDAPARGEVRYHWWVEILPRTTVVAGFEIGTGVLVNTTDPVDAARLLRG